MTDQPTAAEARAKLTKEEALTAVRPITGSDSEFLVALINIADRYRDSGTPAWERFVLLARQFAAYAAAVRREEQEETAARVRELEAQHEHDVARIASMQEYAGPAKLDAANRTITELREALREMLHSETCPCARCKPARALLSKEAGDA